MKSPGVKRPASSMMSALAAVLVLCTAAHGCSHQKPSSTVPKGTVILRIEPEHAHVYIDERLQGTASMFGEKPLLISQGKHRLKLTAEDYFSEYIEINVMEHTETIEIEMRKIPPPLYP